MTDPVEADTMTSLVGVILLIVGGLCLAFVAAGLIRAFIVRIVTGGWPHQSPEARRLFRDPNW